MKKILILLNVLLLTVTCTVGQINTKTSIKNYEKILKVDGVEFAGTRAELLALYPKSLLVNQPKDSLLLYMVALPNKARVRRRVAVGEYPFHIWKGTFRLQTVGEYKGYWLYINKWKQS